LAGLFAVLVGEASHNFFTPALTLQEIQGNKLMRPTPESTIAAITKNGVLAGAELGVLMGVGMGLAGGLIRRSVEGARKGALVGLALGAALGTVASLAFIPLYFVVKRLAATAEPDLSVAMLLHAGVWMSIGAAAGMAFALGRGEPRSTGRAVFGGLLGAFVGTLLYDVIGAAFFPLDGTADPIAQTWYSRSLARVLVPLLSALAIAKFAGDQPGKQLEKAPLSD
jgi:hypothetical protein